MTCLFLHRDIIIVDLIVVRDAVQTIYLFEGLIFNLPDLLFSSFQLLFFIDHILTCIYF